MATVRYLGFSCFRSICQKFKLAHFYVLVQNLVKMGRYAAELLLIFDFQNGGMFVCGWLVVVAG